MIYCHKRTGGLYRYLMISFSVERQAASIVYVSLDNGAVFDRDATKFDENFEYVSDANHNIVPKAPHA